MISTNYKTPSHIVPDLSFSTYNSELKDSNNRLVLACQEYFPSKTEISKIYAIFGPALDGVSGTVELLAISERPTYDITWSRSHILGSLYEIPLYLRSKLPEKLSNDFKNPQKTTSIAKPLHYYDSQMRLMPVSRPRLLPLDYATHRLAKDKINPLFYRISGSVQCPILTPFLIAPSTPRRGSVTYANDGCFFTADQITNILHTPTLIHPQYR